LRGGSHLSVVYQGGEEGEGKEEKEAAGVTSQSPFSLLSALDEAQKQEDRAELHLFLIFLGQKNKSRNTPTLFILFESRATKVHERLHFKII